MFVGAVDREPRVGIGTRGSNLRDKLACSLKRRGFQPTLASPTERRLAQRIVAERDKVEGGVGGGVGGGFSAFADAPARRGTRGRIGSVGSLPRSRHRAQPSGRASARIVVARRPARRRDASRNERDAMRAPRGRRRGRDAATRRGRRVSAASRRGRPNPCPPRVSWDRERRAHGPTSTPRGTPRARRASLARADRSCAPARRQPFAASRDDTRTLIRQIRGVRTRAPAVIERHVYSNDVTRGCLFLQARRLITFARLCSGSFARARRRVRRIEPRTTIREHHDDASPQSSSSS